MKLVLFWLKAIFVQTFVVHSQREVFFRGSFPSINFTHCVPFVEPGLIRCFLDDVPVWQPNVFPIQNLSRWMMGIQKAYIQQCAKLAMVPTLPGLCRISLVATISLIGLALTMAWTLSAHFAGLVCEIFSRSVLKFNVQSSKVLQILKGVVQMRCTCSLVVPGR